VGAFFPAGAGLCIRASDVSSSGGLFVNHAEKDARVCDLLRFQKAFIYLLSVYIYIYVMQEEDR